MMMAEKNPGMSANNPGDVFSTTSCTDTTILQNCDAKINVRKENNVKKFQRKIQPTLEKAYAGGKSEFYKTAQALIQEYPDLENAVNDIASDIIQTRENEIQKRRAELEALEASQGEFFRCEMDDITYRLPPYYKMDNGGIFRYDEKQGYYKQIFPRPVIVSGIAQDIDEENEENKKISYQLSFVNTFEAWQNKLVRARTVADRNEIINLCENGLPVTSENAKSLVTFLNGFITNNPATLPRIKSASRLGWHKGKFVPYDSDILFFGDSPLYRAVADTKGSLEEWQRVMIPARHKSPVFRAMLAASAGSVLLHIVGGLPFVVHVFGSSGCGKSVALRACMSMWGDTKNIVRSLNSTNNALTGFASDMNHLPLGLDELELRDVNESTDELLYQLTEGQSRGRCAKDGTVKQVDTWQNVILTTGEHMATEGSKRGGALNRAFEIPADGKIFDDFASVIECAQSNYGHIGRKFIAGLQDIMKNGVVDEDTGVKQSWEEYKKQILKEIFKSIDDNGKEGKQLDAKKLLLFADMLFSMIIEGKSKADAMSSTAQFEPILCSWTKENVSNDIAQRAYQVLVDYKTQHRSRFQIGTSTVPDCEGRIDNDYFSMLPTIAEKELKDKGFQPADALEKMRQAGILIPDAQGKTKTSLRIDGKNQRVYKIKFIE